MSRVADNKHGRFFDANCFVGRPVKGVYDPAATSLELAAKMDGYGIAKALVWHIAQFELSPMDGNRLLAEAILGQERLCGCWTILPPQTQEVIDESFFARMKQSRIVALRAFPKRHRYILNRVVFGAFLDEVSERRIPLLLSVEKSDADWPMIYKLLEDYPRMTCILCDIAIWGSNRFTWPLLENYPNCHLETSYLSLTEGSLEATCKRFGADRIVFGSAFPQRYPEAAMLQLIHAGISDADKQAIATGNLDNILLKVKL